MGLAMEIWESLNKKQKLTTYESMRSAINKKYQEKKVAEGGVLLPVLQRKRGAFQQRSRRKSSDINSAERTTGEARFQERGHALRVDKEALMLSGGKS